MEVTASVSIISTAVLLFFILDPFGNIPLLLAILKTHPKKQKQKIIIRECLIAFVILAVFLFFGDGLLNAFHLETPAIEIAGAIIFFITGVKMIFGSEEETSNMFGGGEPYVVPIAMPMVAGPAALATLIVLARSNPSEKLELFAGLFLAWLASSVIFLVSPIFYKILGDKGLKALEKLMGMLLLMFASQMFIHATKIVVSTM